MILVSVVLISAGIWLDYQRSIEAKFPEALGAWPISIVLWEKFMLAVVNRTSVRCS